MDKFDSTNAASAAEPAADFIPLEPEFDYNKVRWSDIINLFNAAKQKYNFPPTVSRRAIQWFLYFEWTVYHRFSEQCSFPKCFYRSLRTNLGLPTGDQLFAHYPELKELVVNELDHLFSIRVESSQEWYDLFSSNMDRLTMEEINAFGPIIRKHAHIYSRTKQYDDLHKRYYDLRESYSRYQEKTDQRDRERDRDRADQTEKNQQLEKDYETLQQNYTAQIAAGRAELESYRVTCRNLIAERESLLAQMSYTRIPVYDQYREPVIPIPQQSLAYTIARPF